MTSVVKSRMQAGSKDGQRYTSSLDGLLTIVQEEGLLGLYKGIGTKLAQSVLNAAILFVSQRRLYEITKQVRERESSDSNFRACSTHAYTNLELT
jgi:solute carrier family 25 (peroxisomal adenine nucleotide transporter), member 17